MNKLVTFARLDPLDRALFFRAWWLLWFYHARACWLPFRFLRASLARRRAPGPADPRVTSARVVRAVERASRHALGRHTCLFRALATRSLLDRYGLPSSLQIGVSRADGEFRAHAWLVDGQRVLIGRLPDLDNFKPFPALNEADLIQSFISRP